VQGSSPAGGFGGVPGISLAILVPSQAKGVQRVAPDGGLGIRSLSSEGGAGGTPAGGLGVSPNCSLFIYSPSPLPGERGLGGVG
jgi:hypothetical protein